MDAFTLASASRTLCRNGSDSCAHFERTAGTSRFSPMALAWTWKSNPDSHRASPNTPGFSGTELGAQPTHALLANPRIMGSVLSPNTDSSRDQTSADLASADGVERHPTWLDIAWFDTNRKWWRGTRHRRIEAIWNAEGRLKTSEQSHNSCKRSTNVPIVCHPLFPIAAPYQDPSILRTEHMEIDGIWIRSAQLIGRK